MRRDVVAILAASTVLGCLGCASPSAPSGAQAGAFLAGTWTGTLTLSYVGQPASAWPTRWTFDVMPGTAGSTYTTTIRSSHPELPATIERAITAIVPPGLPPATISTQGGFDHPAGCRVLFGSFGSASSHRITADFSGGDCLHQTFSGSVDLSR